MLFRSEAGAHDGDGLVYAVVHRADVEGLRTEEIESVIDIVRTASEAEVAAVFKEAADADTWTVSLRSKERIDVAAIAAELGGGGHSFAAGYTANGTIDDAVTELLGVLG